MNEELTPTQSVLIRVAGERDRQEKKWGEQNHPFMWDIWNRPEYWATRTTADEAKFSVDSFSAAGTLDYAGIITEEFHEALEAKTRQDQIEELIQLAACAVAAVESLERGN